MIATMIAIATMSLLKLKLSLSKRNPYSRHIHKWNSKLTTELLRYNKIIRHVHVRAHTSHNKKMSPYKIMEPLVISPQTPSFIMPSPQSSVLASTKHLLSTTYLTQPYPASTISLEHSRASPQWSLATQTAHPPLCGHHSVTISIAPQTPGQTITVAETPLTSFVLLQWTSQELI